MTETIELTLESADGTIDCCIEPYTIDGKLCFSATILYPGGSGRYSRSEIFVHNLLPGKGNEYFFESPEEIHPKVRKLEQQLSDVLKVALRK
jgi:hypothetical protein